MLGWIIFRLVQYPPFVEFLIATEAEMNKVSWTSRDDLYRATIGRPGRPSLLMAVFLFGVDWLWSNLLQLIGVLKFGGGGAFGSTRLSDRDRASRPRRTSADRPTAAIARAVRPISASVPTA